MDLTLFPMDSQLCVLEIESYGYTMADLVYDWNDGKKSVQVTFQLSSESQKCQLLCDVVIYLYLFLTPSKEIEREKK